MNPVNELQRSETTAGSIELFVRGRGCPVSWGLPMQHLRCWEFMGKLVGIDLTRAVMTLAVILAPFHPHRGSLTRSALSEIEFRATIAPRLHSIPGSHLVIARDFPQHRPLDKWVYNRADIDRAKAVSAREVPGLSIRPLKCTLLDGTYN